MGFNQKEFNNFVLDNHVIGFFEKPITLKSGRESNWYVNWRTVGEDAFLLDRLSDFVLNFTKDLNLKPKCFYGVPEGATKLGIDTQTKLARQSPNYAIGSHVISMGRGKPKEHGDPKDKYFLGMPRGPTIILEDVTTTGGSLLNTIDNLKQANIPVIAAFGLTNRMELRDDRTSVKQAVESKGIQYHHLSSSLELLPDAYSISEPGKDIAMAVEAEFKQYGVKELKLID